MHHFSFPLVEFFCLSVYLTLCLSHLCANSWAVSYLAGTISHYLSSGEGGIGVGESMEFSFVLIEFTWSLHITNKKIIIAPPPPLSLAVNWQSLFYSSFLILYWRQLPPPSPRSPWELQGPPQNPPILSSHLIPHATPTQSAEHGACYDNLVSGFIHS